jgi:hypothetical protein
VDGVRLASPAAAWYDAASSNLCVSLAGGALPELHTVERARRATAVDLSGLQHVTVRGFNLAAAGVDLRNARNCAIVDCHVRDAGSAGGNEAAVVVGGQANEIRDASVVASAGDGIRLLPESVGTLVLNTRVRGCGLSASNAACVRVAGTAHAVRRCTLRETTGPVLVCDGVQNGRLELNDLAAGGAGAAQCDLVAVRGDGKGTVISRNRVHDSRAAAGVGIALGNPSQHYVVERNVIWGVPGPGLDLRGSNTHHRVFNNTCAWPRAGASPLSAQAIRERTPYKTDANPVGPPLAARLATPGEPLELGGTRIMNNIFIGGVRPFAGEPPTNLFYAANYEGEAPGFTDERREWFTLAPASPCVDAALDVPERSEGFLGAAPDAGAYEHGRAEWLAGADVAEGANRPRRPALRLSLVPEPGTELRYTFDGREPTRADGLYTGQVEVVRDSRVRVRAFNPGGEPGEELDVLLSLPGQEE